MNNKTPELPKVIYLKEMLKISGRIPAPSFFDGRFTTRAGTRDEAYVRRDLVDELIEAAEPGAHQLFDLRIANAIEAIRGESSKDE